MSLRVAAILSCVLLCAAGPLPRGGPGAVRLGGPPHAFLYGTWTGGLFPVLDGMAAQDCRLQPSVVFAQDVVAHGNLINPTMVRRVIETVRGSAAGVEFRLTPDTSDPAGFGCEDANVLHVAREPNGAIAFPHCPAFPYPLVKCPLPGR